MNSRELTINDIEDIKSCIFHHNTIYGVPIDHASLLQKLQNMLTVGRVYGCYDNNICVGISTQHFWKIIPIWIFSNVYVKNSKSTLKLTDYYAEVCLSMMAAGIKYAETKEYFEFYYVVRDSISTSRKKNVKKVIETVNPSLFLERYEIENIHFLSNLADIKWDYIREIIGDVGIKTLSSQNNKTLVIRRGRLSRAAREIN
jgi:hypothetical protein